MLFFLDSGLDFFFSSALSSLNPLPPLSSRLLPHTPPVQALRREPQLASAAVSCFYLRDPIDMRLCNKMRRFPPSTRALGSVRLSRCLYAQLACQKFRAPAAFGTPPPSSAPGAKAFDLGAKLACGMEILAAKVVPEASDMPTVETQAAAQTAAPLDEDPRWRRYRARLAAIGYFKENIQGKRTRGQGSLKGARRG